MWVSHARIQIDNRSRKVLKWHIVLNSLRDIIVKLLHLCRSVKLNYCRVTDVNKTVNKVLIKIHQNTTLPTSTLALRLRVHRLQ